MPDQKQKNKQKSKQTDTTDKNKNNDRIDSLIDAGSGSTPKNKENS